MGTSSSPIRGLLMGNPGPRSQFLNLRTVAGMAYDAVSKKVVLFGGWMGTAVLGDTWLWDGATMTWTRARPLHSPLAAAGVMLFRDPNGASMSLEDGILITIQSFITAICGNGMVRTGCNCIRP